MKKLCMCWMYFRLMFILLSVIVYFYGVSNTVRSCNKYALLLICLLSLLSSFESWFSLILPEPQNNTAVDCTCNWFILFFFLLSLYFLDTWVCVFVCFFECVCGCASVSAENLEKSLRQMEKQLVQLERDLETFSSPDDPNDMFFAKMAISFTHAHTHIHTSAHLQFILSMLLLGLNHSIVR